MSFLLLSLIEFLTTFYRGKSSLSCGNITTKEKPLTDEGSPEDLAENFNTFEYWRTPLPNVDIPDELNCSSSADENVSETTGSHISSWINDTRIVNIKQDTGCYIVIDCPSPEKKQDTEANESTVDNNNETPLNTSTEDDENSPIVKIHIESLKQKTDDSENNKDSTSHYEETADRSVSPRSSAVDNLNDLFSTNLESNIHSDDDDIHVNLNSSSHYTSSLVDDACLQNQVIVSDYCCIFLRMFHRKIFPAFIFKLYLRI